MTVSSVRPGTKNGSKIDPTSTQNGPQINWFMKSCCSWIWYGLAAIRSHHDVNLGIRQAKTYPWPPRGRVWSPPLSDPERTPDFRISRFQDFNISRFQDFKISRFQGFKSSRFRDFKISRFQDFRISGFQDVRMSGFQDSWNPEIRP